MKVIFYIVLFLVVFIFMMMTWPEPEPDKAIKVQWTEISDEHWSCIQFAEKYKVLSEMLAIVPSHFSRDPGIRQSFEVLTDQYQYYQDNCWQYAGHHPIPVPILPPHLTI